VDGADTFACFPTGIADGFVMQEGMVKNTMKIDIDFVRSLL
jgi:hypothetical protein